MPVQAIKVLSHPTKVLSSSFPLTVRSVKGSPLTWEEADKNTQDFRYQDSLFTEKVLYTDNNFISGYTYDIEFVMYIPILDMDLWNIKQPEFFMDIKFKVNDLTYIINDFDIYYDYNDGVGYDYNTCNTGLGNNSINFYSDNEGSTNGWIEISLRPLNQGNITSFEVLVKSNPVYDDVIDINNIEFDTWSD